ncbi:hypothetical protein EJB05_31735, partial [Eragrostis curvula]
MPVCPVPAGAVLYPAMLLLLALLPNPTTAAVPMNTTAPCAQASCGGLNISYPFWLSGTHPPKCGYQAFQVACDKQHRASLINSIWNYQIMHIFYKNSSFRVRNAQLLDGTCEIELNVNASSDLGLAPFTISDRNQELFFLYGCHRQAEPLPRSWAPVSCTNESTNSFAWLAGRYRPDANLTALPGNCTVSVMPVLGYEGATGADYRRLMKRGFLLGYPDDGCEDCMESGGRCQIDDGDDFECYCSDGVICALLVLILPLLAAAAALDATTCAPATCGNLSIRYPFWLRGRQPSYCGYPSFGVACDPTGATPASLNNSYLRVLDIHYGNSSVVASHAKLAEDATACRATRFNMSASLALSLLAVSRANWELLLCANCSWTPPAGSIPVTCPGTLYEPAGPASVLGTVPAGCNYSVVPVLPGSEMRTLGDYAGLVRRGFLLEWTVPGDCAACNTSGGQCRFDAGVNAFRCLCPDGRLRPATCPRGELITETI